MRSIGAAQYALDLMIQRVTDPAKKTFGKYLYQHGTQRVAVKFALLSLSIIGTVVAEIAKSRAEIEGARLLVLSAALQVCPLSFLILHIVVNGFFARSTESKRRAPSKKLE